MQTVAGRLGEWRIGKHRRKSGYRSIPLTDETMDMQRRQKQKNLEVKVIPMEWSEYVFCAERERWLQTARMTLCYLNSVTRKPCKI